MIITILGAAGGVGQATALLLKQKLSAGAELHLVDANPAVKGVALDLSHVPTPVKVTGFLLDDIAAALRGANIVLIIAGVPRKPGMTRDDLFAINARIVADLTWQVAQNAPQATLGIVTNPVNSLVPVAAKVLQKAGAYRKGRLLGITNLDVLRAQVAVGNFLGKDPAKIQVEVIGGHSAETMLPILSAVPELEHASAEELAALRQEVQEGGTRVVEAKAGTGSATLSMGHAAAEFTFAALSGLQGIEREICAYVPTEKAPLPFFAKPIIFGKEGVVAEVAYELMYQLTEAEAQILEKILPVLEQDIQKGNAFDI